MQSLHSVSCLEMDQGGTECKTKSYILRAQAKYRKKVRLLQPEKVHMQYKLDYQRRLQRRLEDPEYDAKLRSYYQSKKQAHRLNSTLHVNTNLLHGIVDRVVTQDLPIKQPVNLETVKGHIVQYITDQLSSPAHFCDSSKNVHQLILERRNRIYNVYAILVFHRLLHFCPNLSMLNFTKCLGMSRQTFVNNQQMLHTSFPSLFQQDLPDAIYLAP